jgi:hypothetical protein
MIGMNQLSDSRRRRHTKPRQTKPAPSNASDGGSGVATSVITTSPLPVWKSARRIWSMPASNEPPQAPGATQSWI